jgi:hypothetical protein
MSIPSTVPVYPARLEIDYSEQHDRVSTLFRVGRAQRPAVRGLPARPRRSSAAHHDS